MPATDETWSSPSPSKPTACAVLHRAEGPGLGDDRRAQRVRERARTTPACPLAAHVAAAYEWHNYGKSHHRQPQRHRARADRESAGLLPEVLPARQRRADRRRQVRRGEGARHLAATFGSIPKPTREARRHLHRGAAAGRRAHGDPAPRRRGASVAGVPHPRRAAPRLAPSVLAATCSGDPDGPAVQGAVESKKAAEAYTAPPRARSPGLRVLLPEAKPASSVEAAGTRCSHARGLGRCPFTAGRGRAARKVISCAAPRRR